MLSTLARIANQLEADGRIEMADQVDEIISVLASRESFPHYEPGGLWKEELEGVESNQDEELEEGGLEPHDESELGGSNLTYTALLQDHLQSFKRFLAADDLVQAFSNYGAGSPHADRGLIDALLDKLEYAIELWSERKGVQIESDDGFRDVALGLIRKVLEEASAPRA